MHYHFRRFFRQVKGSCFLLGPRGTGKTTWLRRHFPEAIWVNLLEPEQFRLYSANPERLRQHIDAYPKQRIVVIDEIQKVPELLSLIHALIEEKRDLQFIMTGSSTRRLKTGDVNLLGGRAQKIHMHPFFAAELGTAFHLQKALEIGMLPLVWDSQDPLGILRGYAGIYLQEEVKGEGVVRNIGDFARFMEVISFSHGELLNTTNIARDCDVSRKTVENYIDILKDLLLAFVVPVFTRRAQRATISHSKLYLFDVGVYRTLRPLGPIDRIEEIDGASLEGMIAQHLKSWIDFQQEKYSLSFWRTRSGLEVDFIVYGPDLLLAIEVKNRTRVSSKDLRGLTSFCEDYPEATPLMLYRGERKMTIQGVLCVPCEEFLRGIRPEKRLW